MNASKAKEILEKDLEDLVMPHKAGVRAATRISIEAIDAYLKGKEAGWYPPGYKLPSETEE